MSGRRQANSCSLIETNRCLLLSRNVATQCQCTMQRVKSTCSVDLLSKTMEVYPQQSACVTIDQNVLLVAGFRYQAEHERPMVRDLRTRRSNAAGSVGIDPIV